MEQARRTYYVALAYPFRLTPKMLNQAPKGSINVSGRVASGSTPEEALQQVLVASFWNLDLKWAQVHSQ